MIENMPYPESPHGFLTRAQIERLRLAIDTKHVDRKQGKMKYIAQHEARAELTRIFGYGNWDTQVESMELLFEYEVPPTHPEYPRDAQGKPKSDAKPMYYRACYRAGVRLNIRDYWGRPVCSFVEFHAELNSILPDRGEAHAMAVTSVESYALRRAAIGLGDRLGLGLYDGGNETALVANSLQFTDEESPWYIPPDQRVTPSQNPDRLQAAMNVADEEQMAMDIRESGSRP